MNAPADLRPSHESLPPLNPQPAASIHEVDIDSAARAVRRHAICPTIPPESERAAMRWDRLRAPVCQGVDLVTAQRDSSD
jgi:hypothetical protein